MIQIACAQTYLNTHTQTHTHRLIHTLSLTHGTIVQILLFGFLLGAIFLFSSSFPLLFTLILIFFFIFTVFNYVLFWLFIFFFITHTTFYRSKSFQYIDKKPAI